MSEIKERLDKVRALIQEPEFLEGKGLSNEVNIRIFCYEPENEMVVRHFVNQLETDQFLDCHLIVCNLYKTFLSICDDMDITYSIQDQLLQVIQGTHKPLQLRNRFSLLLVQTNI